MEKDLGDAINILSSRNDSGRLQITAGLTEGELFFDKGQLVDARMGKLSGFQAINAISSLRDPTFKFDPSITPPAQSSITANERRLLKDFFGIGTIRPEAPPDSDATFWPEDQTPPQQVVPLAAVEEIEHSPSDAHIRTDSLPRIVNNESLWADPAATAAATVTEDAEPLHPSEQSEQERQLPPPSYADKDRETTSVGGDVLRDEPPRVPLVSSSGFRLPAALAVLLILIVAVLAIALAYRARQQNESSSVASAAHTTTPNQTSTPSDTSSPADVQQVAKDDVAKSDHETARATDLSGNWTIINTVEKTSYQSFKNMQVGFNLAINQSGKQFTGRGEKISENGRTLPDASRTPITVKGSIDGNKVEASFSEQGEARKSTGHFVWRIDKRGGLNGRFNSTAARASGKSAAKKQS